MKCLVLRCTLGKTVHAAIEVELGELDHRATYADILEAAKIRFDENTMQLMFGRPGDTFFAGHTSSDSYVEDGETVGVFDLTLFTAAPAGTPKPSK